jgi:hypothetical protein
MRPGTRRQIVYEVREIAKTAERLAASIEQAQLPDLRRVGVGWTVDGTREMDVGGTYVFREGRHVIAIIRSLAWGLFEMKRRGSEPVDPIALAEVRAILIEIGEKILHGPPERCKKCDGLQTICVACGGECRVPYKENTQETHDRTKVLCPECSSWLSPEGLR